MREGCLSCNFAKRSQHLLSIRSKKISQRNLSVFDVTGDTSNCNPLIKHAFRNTPEGEVQGAERQERQKVRRREEGRRSKGYKGAEVKDQRSVGRREKEKKRDGGVK